MAGLLAAQPAGAAGPVPVPSGREVTLLEVVHNVPGPEGLATHFRFVAPALAADADFEGVAADLAALCNGYALARIASPAPRPAQIVIALSDRASGFGDVDPDAVQYIAAFHEEAGRCVEDVL